MKNFWNERYADEDYVYGKTPNEYFKEKIDEMPPGKILLPAEGEGRNAVYAASLDREVDISEKGKEKALNLANKQSVEIDYKVGDLPDLDYKDEQRM
ncbi:class I SAM-dependent methyltransferase [Salegentibacter sp. UBA1130]|uniref:class I SAM-dependent methyltransferase n=1 Tax=Salegentibacter sp. UBA1130 TaxID=1947451 RepID=UPI0030D8D6DF